MSSDLPKEYDAPLRGPSDQRHAARLVLAGLFAALACAESPVRAHDDSGVAGRAAASYSAHEPTLDVEDWAQRAHARARALPTRSERWSRRLTRSPLESTHLAELPSPRKRTK